MAAPILLTALRMLQGLSIGGECTTAFIFLAERASPERRGFASALASSSITVGILLGSATGAAFSAVLSPEALVEWGWRVPFILGVVVGLAGFALRRRADAEPAVVAPAVVAPPIRSPLAETLREHPALLAKLAGLAAFNAVGFFLVFLYVASWLQLADGVAPARALGVTTLALLVLIPVELGAGWLSDRIGRKGPMLAAIGLCFVFAYPLFSLMHHDNATMVLLAELALVVLVGIPLGIQAALMVEATPAHVRCTAVALGNNTAFGIIGGLTPLAATWLVQRVGNDLSPAFLIMGAAAISFTALLLFRDLSPAATRVAQSGTRR